MVLASTRGTALVGRIGARNIRRLARIDEMWRRRAARATGAVMIAGVVSLGIAGDYIYFGAMHDRVSMLRMLKICPLMGVIGGVSGGLFSHLARRFGQTTWPPIARIRRHPVLWAIACGAFIATAGYASDGFTWGTGYVSARSIIDGRGAPSRFGPSEVLATLVSQLSGVPAAVSRPRFRREPASAPPSPPCFRPSLRRRSA